MLAEFLRTKSPKAKSWSYSTIYRMVKFYETYSSEKFIQLVNHYGMHNYQVEARFIELPSNWESIVSIELTQIPSVLFSIGWSNHQLIMRQCKTDEQRLFYMLYAGREQLEYKELQRAMKTDAMSAILGSKDVQSEMMKRSYPQSGVLFKDIASDIGCKRYV